MNEWSLRKIDNAKERLIDEIILNTCEMPTKSEIKDAKNAIARYDKYAGILANKPEYEIEIPKGVQSFIGRVQSSSISAPTQSIAIAHMLDQEMRFKYQIVIYAVDAGIHAASFGCYNVKQQRSTEKELRKYLALDVGKSKIRKDSFKRYEMLLYKAIADCLRAGSPVH